MPTLISNIKSIVNVRAGNECLRRNDLAHLPCITDGYIVIEGSEIAEVGSMDNLIHSHSSFTENYNAEGSFVLPSWCDSHTHIVFAGSRENEFVDKINGMSYADIAAKGGGILNSASLLNQTSEDELFNQSYKRLLEVIKLGTGAIEIKSGYGLTVESELKMLRVIKRLKNTFPIPIKATLLAAHTYPQSYKNDHQGYIKLIINKMLPLVAEEKLADYIDVFCERGFFSVEETDQILSAASQYGLKPKIHANQLSVSGGVQIGVKNGAISVDHLEETDVEVLKSLANNTTIATLLPSCSFFLNIPFANARGLMNNNAAIALASDYNPGSTPSGNMNFVVSLACIKLKMMPEEAINAATLNGAAAMELSAEMGSIAIGKRANLFITRAMPSLAYLPYSFGQSQIETVILNGQIYHG